MAEPQAVSSFAAQYSISFLRKELTNFVKMGLKNTASKEIEKLFQTLEWYQVFDFIEFLYGALLEWEHQNQDGPTSSRKLYARKAADHLSSAIERVLLEENVGYRFYKGRITPIASENALQSIDRAYQSSRSARFIRSREHLEKAVSLFSNSKSPDYENTIKEAISALEALARELTEDSSATLGQAITRIGKELNLHKALVAAIEKLYGYASDESGIRHSKKEGRPSPTQADALLILTISSALVDYLINRSRELD